LWLWSDCGERLWNRAGRGPDVSDAQLDHLASD
jgi:hypothetical protein